LLQKWNGPKNGIFTPKRVLKPYFLREIIMKKRGYLPRFTFFTLFFPAEKSADIEACLLFPEKYYPLFD